MSWVVDRLRSVCDSRAIGDGRPVRLHLRRGGLAYRQAHRHVRQAALKDFSRAYNARRQRVLGGLSPDEAVRQRIKANPKLASKGYEPPSDPCVLPKALLVVTAAKEVSHPDS